jgi:hypothetical protein
VRSWFGFAISGPGHSIGHIGVGQLQLYQFGPHCVPALDAHGREDDLPGSGLYVKVFRGTTACVTLLGSVSWFLEVILASIAFDRK